MAEKISRRELAKRSLIGAAALTVPGLLRAQDPASGAKPDPEIDKKVAAIESKLAKPLSAKAKELLKSSIAGAESNSASRLKHALPENSEPCFMYEVTTAEKKK